MSANYRVRIKICGITTPEDALQAAALGADAIGLNFYPPSPRYIDGERAAAILDVLPQTVQSIAVVVDEPLDNLERLPWPARRFGTIQRHGTPMPPPADLQLPYIAAFSVRDAEHLLYIGETIESYRLLGRPVAAVLLDAHVAGLWGGTGQTAPWEVLAHFQCGAPIILAGGLTPENVGEAIRIVQPYAVDVASGVESAPGRKDANKMQRFIEAAQAAAAICPGPSVAWDRDVLSTTRRDRA